MKKMKSRDIDSSLKYFIIEYNYAKERVRGFAISDARTSSRQLTGTITTILLVSELSKLNMYCLLDLISQLKDRIPSFPVYVRFNQKLEF